MITTIVIPARWASSRLPGKPLTAIAGKSLLQRVYNIARSVKGVDQVLIATDDARIQQHAEAFGAKVIMTDPACRNGTERVQQAIERSGFKADVVINLQGDAVLTPPWFLQALVDEMSNNPQVAMATPAVALDRSSYNQILASKKIQPSAGTFVVFGTNRDALYFSKSPIPFIRGEYSEARPVYKHIGVYAYRASMLKRYLSLAPTPFEQSEELEQLRVLEHGLPIRVVVVETRGRTLWSVDTPEDLVQAETIIAREGELI